LAWRFPDAALSAAAFAVLAVRPSLDVFSRRGLGIGSSAPSPAVVFGLVVLFVGAVLAASRVRNGRRLWPDARLLHAHVWLLVAYLIALAAGWRWYGTYGIGVGLRDAVRMASIVAGFLLVAWWIEGSGARYGIGWQWLAIGLVVPVTVALGQLVSGSGNRDIPGINRLQGTFSHPNAFGPYLVPFILFLAGGLRTSRSAAARNVLLAAGLMVLVALTYSRTAVLLLISALAALSVLQLRRLEWRALAGSSAAILLVGLIAWLLVGDVIRERFSDLRLGPAAVDQSGLEEGDNSLKWRLRNWAVLIALGSEHSLVGHGAGMTTELNPIVNLDTGLPYNAHNDFVRFFFEGGLLGLLAYGAYGVLLCRWSLLLARSVGARAPPGMAAVVAALLAHFFLTGGATEFGQQTAIQFEIYGMLALITTPWSRAAESNPSSL
jgi:O-antigen ligase